MCGSNAANSMVVLPFLVAAHIIRFAVAVTAK